MSKARHRGLTAVAVFAILCGVGEVIVGFTGNYLGILSKSIQPSFSTVIVGLFYGLGGLSLLTMKKWGAALGILFIAAEIFGRIYLVLSGIVPIRGTDILKVAVGAAIAFAVILYILARWNEFH